MRPHVRRVLAAAGLCVAVLPGWVLYHSQDLPAVNEIHLMVVWVEAPREDNGAVRLAQAARLAAWPRVPDAHPRIRALRLFETWDAGAARALLAPNAPALAEVGLGLDAPAFAVSSSELVVRHPSVGMSLYVAWTDLARLLALRSALHLADGEQRAAFAAALDVVRLGDRIQRAGSPTLAHGVLGLGIKTVGLEQILALVPRSALTPAEARAIGLELERARGDTEMWKRIFAGEYQATKPTFLWGLKGGTGLVQLLPRAYLVHPNRTMTELASHFRRFQRNAAVVCADMERPAPAAPLSRWARVFAPNSAGENLMQIARPNFDGFQRRRCGVETLISVAQGMVALRAHREAYAELPATLDVLVPDILDAVPQCGYRGTPLRYSRDERTLYSEARDAPGFPITF